MPDKSLETGRNSRERSRSLILKGKQRLEVNKWRKEFGYKEYESGWGTKNPSFDYNYEKDLYKYNVAVRNNQHATYAAEQRKRVRKTKTRRRAFGPSTSLRANGNSGSNGGEISNYRRVGKTSLIQRALQTGSSSKTGISVPK